MGRSPTLAGVGLYGDKRRRRGWADPLEIAPGRCGVGQRPDPGQPSTTVAADRLDGLIGIGLAKNADNLFGAVVFLFHEATP